MDIVTNMLSILLCVCVYSGCKNNKWIFNWLSRKIKGYMFYYPNHSMIILKLKMQGLLRMTKWRGVWFHNKQKLNLEYIFL